MLWVLGPLPAEQHHPCEQRVCRVRSLAFSVSWRLDTSASRQGQFGLPVANKIDFPNFVYSQDGATQLSGLVGQIILAGML